LFNPEALNYLQQGMIGEDLNMNAEYEVIKEIETSYGAG